MIGVCVRRGMASRLTGFMRIAHLLPRQRGNVAVDNYRFVNALLWMCRTGLRGGICRSAMASGSPSAGGSTTGPGTARWNACSRHCRRSGSSPSRSGCPPPDSTSVKVHQHAVVPPKRNRTDPWGYDREAHKGRNMVERVFNRMKHHRKAATRYDRLDATFLANLQLILIAIQLKNTSKTN